MALLKSSEFDRCGVLNIEGASLTQQQGGSVSGSSFLNKAYVSNRVVPYVHDWVRLGLVAVVVFIALAGGGALLLPPDVISTFPLSVVPLLICWPVAYWFVYYREGKTPFQSDD